MDFLLNKRVSGANNASAKEKNDQNVCHDSTDSTVHSHHFLFGLLEDSGIATSNDAHSLEFDDQIPVTPPPTIVIEQHIDKADVVLKHPTVRIGTFEKSKASSSIPSLSVNSTATINIHYYPEESIFWSYVIVFIAVTVQMFTHGLQLSFGVLFVAARMFFKNDQSIAIGKCKLFLLKFYSVFVKKSSHQPRQERRVLNKSAVHYTSHFVISKYQFNFHKCYKKSCFH